MSRLFVVWALVLVPVFAFSSDLDFPYVPDYDNRGSLCSQKDPDFKEYAYSQKLPKCHRSVSRGTKTQLYRRYGVSEKCRKFHTIDHFIPLSIGGSNKVSNLWPEHRAIKELRFDLEFEVYTEVKMGLMTQDEGIEIITMAKLDPPIEDLGNDACLNHKEFKKTH